MLVRYNKDAKVSESFLRKHHGKLIEDLLDSGTMTVEEVMHQYNMYSISHYEPFFEDGEVYVVETEEQRKERYLSIGKAAPDYNGEVVSVVLNETQAVEIPLFMLEEVECH